MPGLCAVHKKRIPPGQFGYMLWYMVKSPRKEYSIGRRRIPDEKTGNARFKQNSRNIRPGHCVKVFHLMREIYLDQLAMAGGEGRKSLQQIKYEALRDYRRKLGGGRRSTIIVILVLLSAIIIRLEYRYCGAESARRKIYISTNRDSLQRNADSLQRSALEIASKM
jgi:hypothetical protein